MPAGQPQHKVTEFIDDMAAAYAWADVVVCRFRCVNDGEIAAAGLPALFVPFQHKDRQQYWNAPPLEKRAQPKLSSSRLAWMLSFACSRVVARNLINHGRTRPRCIHSRMPPSEWQMEVSRAARA